MARSNAAFEEGHPGICLRVRYEDLAVANAAVLEEVTAFIEAAAARPGERRQGAAFTGAAGVTAGPGGSAAIGDGPAPAPRLPLQAIPGALHGKVDQLLARLGYPALGDERGTLSYTPAVPVTGMTYQ